MSDIGNIGSRGIQQTSLDQGVNAPGKVGNLGGHSVSQASTAQTPARGSGIGDKIANFFTSTLPNFFSSVGQSISNFFSKLTAPTPLPHVEMSSSNLSRVSGDKTPATSGDLKAVYDAIKEETDAITNPGTFLRGKSPHSKVMAENLKEFAQSWVQDVRDSLPESKTVAFIKDSFEDNSRFGRALPKETAPTSVAFLKAGWEQLFGSDETTAKEKAGQLPQSVKDLIATGFKAIDDSKAPEHTKQTLKDKFAADVLLRGLTPQLLINSPPGDTVSSMMELSKIIQSIANGVDPSNSGKEPLLGQVSDMLGNSHVVMRDNMITMLREAGSQGVAYSPGTSTDDVKELTSRTDMPPLPPTPTPSPTSSTTQISTSGLDEHKD